MKAIYINIDPYLQAVADWLNAGKPGTTPSFDPLPLAVTVPMGQDVGILCPGYSGDEPAEFLVDGLNMTAQAQGSFDPATGTNIAQDISPGFSAFPAGTYFGQQYYAVKAVTDSQISFTVKIGETDEGDIATIAFPVLVRRETASGPVDLVDFTPPAAPPSAADIKSALVAAGAGALAGVAINGTKYLMDGETELSSVTADTGAVPGYNICIVSNPGS